MPKKYQKNAAKPTLDDDARLAAVKTSVVPVPGEHSTWHMSYEALLSRLK